ncbi:MAG: hypothetical protein SGARI_005035, partial [Bacillariaceae sp.]
MTLPSRTMTAFHILLAVVFNTLSLSEAIKIAFVGDTGMEDRRYHGYGDLTMKMIDDEDVDLVVDVGDFEYWGACTEIYNVTQPLQIVSTWGRIVNVPSGAILKRFKWQDGRHGTIRGWEVGIELVLDNDNNNLFLERADLEDTTVLSTLEIDRLVISERTWNLAQYALIETDDCWGRPWDGPFDWS